MSATVGIEISFKLSSPAGDNADLSESMNGTAANGKHYGERNLRQPKAHNCLKKKAQ